MAFAFLFLAILYVQKIRLYNTNTSLPMLIEIEKPTCFALYHAAPVTYYTQIVIYVDIASRYKHIQWNGWHSPYKTMNTSI